MDNHKDPACGMDVVPGAAKGGSADHDGVTYHFCSARCREKFLADPKRYTAAAPGPPSAVPGTEYVCPMHPQIVRSAPGSCPICGMALEPRVATLGDDDNPELRDMTRRFWGSVAPAAPTLILAMGDVLPGDPLPPVLSARDVVFLQLALSSPVVLWAGWPLLERGWASITNRHLNMFTLIALGIGVAYLFSVVATVAPGILPDAFRSHGGAPPVYFEAA